VAFIFDSGGRENQRNKMGERNGDINIGGLTGQMLPLLPPLLPLVPLLLPLVLTVLLCKLSSVDPKKSPTASVSSGQLSIIFPPTPPPVT
jgi:hypothetical protein